MNYEQLVRKLQDESALSAEEQVALDELLEKQSPVAHCVGSLKSEEPSMEWRSSAKEKALAIVKKARRAATWQLRMAGVTLAGAAACTYFAMIYVGGLNAPEKVTTETMLKWHEEAVAASVLPGDGVNLAGVSSLPKRTTSGEDDLFDGGSISSL